ncbi:MAG TPA: hypothetical protein VF753_16105 [Terriglobales bacterium]
MTAIDDNHYATVSGEIISVTTQVDKQPFLVGFSNPPDNATWQNITPLANGDKRSFTMPDANDPTQIVRYVATYSESIAAGDPDPTQTYTVVISGSAGGTRTSYIVIGAGSLPIQIPYYFVKTV